MKQASDAYIASEESSTGKPVELYHVWHDDGRNWRYTSGDVAVQYGGVTYEPATIERDSVQYNSDLEVSTLTVRAGRLVGPVTEFLALNPVEILWIKTLRLFRDQDPLEGQVVFIGQIKSVSFKGAEAAVECVGFEFFLKQPVPRYRYQPGCGNTLYDAKCTLDKDDYSATATLTSVSSDGLTLTAVEFALESDGYYTMGYMVYGDHKRMITAHEGEEVTLRYRIPELPANVGVTVYAGCDKSCETCRDKFDNITSFFGFPYIPIENPVTRV